MSDPKREEQAPAEWALALMGEIAKAVSSESGGSTWIDPDDYGWGARVIADAFEARLAEVAAERERAKERAAKAEEDAKQAREDHHALGKWQDCPHCTRYFRQDEEGAARNARLEEALRAVMQFMEPDVHRGPDSPGWNNSRMLAEAALAPPARQEQENGTGGSE